MSPLVWVSKNPSSAKLSQSSRAEESIIRRHVQATRTLRLKTLSNGRDTIGSATRQRSGSKSQLLPVPANVPFYRRSIQEKDEELSITHLAQDNNANQALIYVDAQGWGPTREPKISMRDDTLALTPHERRSLAFFEARTAHEWSGWLDMEFWNRVVLQLSHSSKVVAHSLIALSALHESLGPSLSRESASRLRRFSLTQSAKAAYAGNTAHLNYVEALASCIVLYCLQSFQQPQTATTLLRAGLDMLTEYVKRTSVPQQHASLIESSLRPIFDHLRRRPCRMNDAVRCFQISSITHRRQMQHVESSDRISSRIPTAFNTTSEAKTVLETILNWGHDNAPLQDLDPTSIQNFHETFDKLSAGWNAALCQSTAMIRPWAQDPTRLMRAALLFGRIVIHASLSETDMIFDEHLAEFDEIMHIIEDALRLKSGSNVSFGIDGGLVNMLAFVGSKCRDPFIRRRALTQLLYAGRIEGDRLASVPGAIVERMIEAEEGGRNVTSCNDVAARDRRRIIFGQQFFSQRRIRLYMESTERCDWTGWGIEHFDIDLPRPGQTTPSSAASSDVPNVIIGSGYVAYLDDPNTKKYFKLRLDKFDFPIPRV